MTKANWIAFDTARIRVRTDMETADFGECVEFLEGLDIGDPEFEDWLRDQRQLYSELSQKTTSAPQIPVKTLHITHRESTCICDREHIDAMVAAAALAGCLMQRQDCSSLRLVQDDLLKALRSSHVPHADEIVRAIAPLLAPDRREARGRVSTIRRH